MVKSPLGLDTQILVSTRVPKFVEDWMWVLNTQTDDIGTYEQVLSILVFHDKC